MLPVDIAPDALPPDGRPPDGRPSDGPPAGGAPASRAPAGDTPAHATPAGGTPAGGSTPPTLSAFDIGCIAVGGIIGVGIFFTPSKVAAHCENATQVVVAWGLGGVLAVLGALVFAGFACRVRGHGGTFVYLHQAFGPLPAFLYGWANWLVIQAGALGVIGLVLVDNLDQLLYGALRTGPHLKVALAALSILLFTGVNLLGLRVGKTTQNLLTITKSIAVFGIVGLALWTTGTAGSIPEPGAQAQVGERGGYLMGLAAAMLPVMFAFGGWQQASFVAGAARRPLRDVPLGLIGGVLFVVLAYVTVNLAFLDLLGFKGVAESPTVGVDAARAALSSHGLGELAGRILAGMIVISSCGILNTVCLAPPYVLHTMARRGLFFRAVGTLHPTRHVPVLGVLVQGLWGIVLLLGTHLVMTLSGSGRNTIDALDFLLTGVVFVDWLFFALTGLALLRLQRRSGAAPVAFAAPGGPVVAAVFTLLGLLITIGAFSVAPESSRIGLLICALGLPFFWIMQRMRRTRADQGGAHA